MNTFEGPQKNTEESVIIHVTPGSLPPEIKNLNSFMEVNLYKNAQKATEMGFLKGGMEGFIISPVDNSDKYSDGLFNCTALAVWGVDRQTKENISLLTHQSPMYILYNMTDNFTDSLSHRLKDLMQKCDPRTINAVIVGGSIPQQTSQQRKKGTRVRNTQIQ